ncbi:MAG: hypothetical protein ISR72_01805 [Methylobacter sp.]|nr:hypothetical protein [Methylobacter sp.]
MKHPTPPLATDLDALYDEIRQLIETAKAHVLTQVNQALVLTYWQIGKTIKTEVLLDDRAEYGNATIKRLAKKLVAEYGNGFGQRNLFRMAKFYQQFPNCKILSTVSAQLSWSHFVELLKLDNPIKREFYIGLCSSGRWSVRTLRERMDSMLFERTAISKQPDTLIRQELAQLQQQSADANSALFLKAPYLLDFLDLKDNFTEKDLKNAILMDLEPDNIHIGEYWLKLPPKKVLQAKLHRAMHEAKMRLEFQYEGGCDE